MKKLFTVLTTVTLLLGLSACSGEIKPLSASSAKSALKKEAIFAKDSQVTTFTTGFQEVTDEYLNKLAQLKEAGVVEYTVESATEKREYREGSYWRGYYTVTREINHTFADVKLTPKGQKLVVEEPRKLRADIAKDMALNKDYEEQVPDYMLTAAIPSPIEEVTAEPDVEEFVEEVVEEVVADTVAADTAVIAEEIVEEAAAPEPVNENAAYEAMMARIETETVNVLLGHYEIVKVKEILCTDDMLKEGKASCTVLVKFVDKTPFGFVLGAPKEDYINSARIKFIYYQDMGWTVDED